MLLAFVVQDATMVGLFAAASALFSRIWILAESLQLALLPRSVADAEGRAELVAQITRLCLAVCAVATLVALVFAKPLIAVLLSPRFLPVHGAVLVLLPGILIRVIAKVLPAYFAGTNRPGVTSTAIAVAVAVNIALMFLLLPHWGLIGAALAMSVAYALEALILAIAFRTFSGHSLRDLICLTPGDLAAMLNGMRRVLGRPARVPPCTGEVHAR
jgi:O-antigen/teichoic acid export membrane protein